MSAVTKQEIVTALQGASFEIPVVAAERSEYLMRLADAIEQHGIAPEPKGEEAIAPPDGYLLVHKDIMTLTVECRCGVQQAKPVHHYLKQADEETHRRVDDAVRAGRIFDKRFRGGFVSVPVEPIRRCSMNREDIIRIAIGTARENGNFRRCFLTDQDLEKIADIAYAAGAAAEREACAKVCEEIGPKGVSFDLITQGFAGAIRARGNGGEK